MLARCGGSSERYFAMVDLLFNKQATWLASRQPKGIADALKKLGMESGLTEAQFNTCMNDKPLAEAMVASYQKNATADHVQGTPSFVVDGKLYENMAWPDFKKILDDEIAKKTKG
jgi:protein-disulfide isomerase